MKLLLGLGVGRRVHLEAFRAVECEERAVSGPRFVEEVGQAGVGPRVLRVPLPHLSPWPLASNELLSGTDGGVALRVEAEDPRALAREGFPPCGPQRRPAPFSVVEPLQQRPDLVADEVRALLQWLD